MSVTFSANMSIPAQVSPASPALSATGCPFEGPEKLLEIWFAPSPEELPPPVQNTDGLRLRPTKGKGREAEWQGLRRVGREVWEEMLDVVKCKVLSYVEGADLDAYLLRWVARCRADVANRPCLSLRT